MLHPNVPAPPLLAPLQATPLIPPILEGTEESKSRKSDTTVAEIEGNSGFLSALTACTNQLLDIDESTVVIANEVLGGGVDGELNSQQMARSLMACNASFVHVSATLHAESETAPTKSILVGDGDDNVVLTVASSTVSIEDLSRLLEVSTLLSTLLLVKIEGVTRTYILLLFADCIANVY